VGDYLPVLQRSRPTRRNFVIAGKAANTLVGKLATGMGPEGWLDSRDTLRGVLPYMSLYFTPRMNVVKSLFGWLQRLRNVSVTGYFARTLRY
jgi:hypothetical protein